MKKAWLVAQWEFRAAVFRRAYIITVIAMPLVFIGLGSISVLTTASAARSTSARPVAIVDKAGIVDLAFASEQAVRRDQLRSPDALTTAAANMTGASSLMAYSDEHQALDDLVSQKVAAVYVVEADYLNTGNITAYGRDVSLFSQAPANQRSTAVGDAIRASLMHKGLANAELDRAYAPVLRIKRLSVNSTGRIEDASDALGVGRFGTSMGVFILFTISIFFSAGFLQQATVEDRQNRVFEVLLSSVNVDALIIGKIAGLGAAGLLQIGFYILVILATGSTVMPSLSITGSQLALSLAYFVIGYLMFASLMAAIGMIARTAQESAQLSTIWTLAAMAPMFFLFSISTAPNGTVSRVLSFFPLSSPTTMLLRLSITSDVPRIDIIGSLALGAVAVYVALRGTIKIFRAATLMYGKRPTLPELMRWLRAA